LNAAEVRGRKVRERNTIHEGGGRELTQKRMRIQRVVGVFGKAVSGEGDSPTIRSNRKKREQRAGTGVLKLY